MNPTWRSEDAPSQPGPQDVRAWLRALRRGVPLGLVVFGGLALLLLLRLVERPLCGARRPVTPWITQIVCAAACVLMGLRRRVRGRAAQGHIVQVANHASWLDIFALNASDRIYFVSKSEVAGWPGIGWLARATGTVFINRNRKEARAQTEMLAARLAQGHRLLAFPEGTSTDGWRVLPFKSTLFQPFFSDALRHTLHVQPVTVIYRAPEGADPRFYGWWGDMEFGEHLLKVLAEKRHGSVEVVYHAPVPVSDFAGRKELALRCETTVRCYLDAALGSLDARRSDDCSNAPSTAGEGAQ